MKEGHSDFQVSRERKKEQIKHLVTQKRERERET